MGLLMLVVEIVINETYFPRISTGIDMKALFIDSTHIIREYEYARG
jgi:hypothetical protein